MRDEERAAAPERARAVMRTPREVDVEITSRCNLRCRYCYFFDNPSVEYRDLPTAEWLSFFEELGRCAVMKVCIAGGEPFIREDLRELLDGIVRNRMRFSILSNGGLIDDDIARFLKETHRCDYVQISVDGSTAETHDAGRGRGSFEGAIRGIKTLQRQGVQVAVRVTIHHQNVHDLEGIARLLLEELGLGSFGTNSASALGTCRERGAAIQLTQEDRLVAMRTLLRLTRKYPGRISAQAGPLAEARMWGKMVRACEENAPAFPDGGRLTGCGCPSSKMAVRSDGVMTPCPMLAHLELGRVNHDRLEEVWQTSPAINALRRRREITLDRFEHCAGCEYLPYCTGNCPGLAYSILGVVDHPSPDACLRRYLAEGGKLPDPEPACSDPSPRARAEESDDC